MLNQLRHWPTSLGIVLLALCLIWTVGQAHLTHAVQLEVLVAQELTPTVTQLPRSPTPPIPWATETPPARPKPLPPTPRATTATPLQEVVTYLPLVVNNVWVLPDIWGYPTNTPTATPTIPRPIIPIATTPVLPFPISSATPIPSLTTTPPMSTPTPCLSDARIERQTIDTHGGTVRILGGNRAWYIAIGVGQGRKPEAGDPFPGYWPIHQAWGNPETSWKWWDASKWDWYIVVWSTYDDCGNIVGGYEFYLMPDGIATRTPTPTNPPPGRPTGTPWPTATMPVQPPTNTPIAINTPTATRIHPPTPGTDPTAVRPR